MALLKKTPIQIPDLNTRLQKEEEFFSKPFYLSYSGLSKLLHSPTLFYRHYILNQRDPDDDKTLEGRLIHQLLLQPEKFDDHFVLASNDVIGGKGKILLDILFEQQSYTFASDENYVPVKQSLENLMNEVLAIMQDIDYQQIIKDPTVRFNKILNSKAVEYWDFLWNSRGKQLVSPEIMINATALVEKIKAMGNISLLMGNIFDKTFSDITNMNELHLVADLNEQFGIHGIIDNLVIDHENKVIRINDIKTTGKDITKFTESIEYYNYYLQAAIYTLLVQKTMLPEGYKTEFRFIVIDNYGQIAPIKVSDETMSLYTERLLESIDIAQWHFKNRTFDLPYAFEICNKELVI
jgi:hypothetical protein